MNVTQIVAKGKQFLSGDVLVALIIIFVGLASFGLGRLSVSEGKKEPLSIIYPDGTQERTEVVLKNGTVAKSQVASVSAAADASGSEVVASKNGTKYYLPTCSGVSRISPANLVTFPSPQAARDSGYEPAANCPGL